MLVHLRRYNICYEVFCLVIALFAIRKCYLMWRTPSVRELFPGCRRLFQVLVYI